MYRIPVSKTVDYAITLAEMPTFVQECDRLFAEDERMKMLTHLAIHLRLAMLCRIPAGCANCDGAFAI